MKGMWYRLDHSVLGSVATHSGLMPTDVREDVAIIIRQQNDSQSEKHDGVSLQDFSGIKLNPVILLGGHGKKRRFYGANCRTQVVRGYP